MSRTEFSARLTATGSPAAFTGKFLAEPDTTPAEFSATVAVDARAHTGAMPPLGQQQIVGIEVEWKGARVPQKYFTGGYKIQLSSKQSLQQWSFGTWVMLNGSDIFGNPVIVFGPPLGTGNVDIYGIYMVGGAKLRIPLILRGLCGTFEGGGDLNSGVFNAYSGFDAAARVQRKKVTIIRPFGHNQTKVQIGQAAMTQAGETQIALEDNGVKMLRNLEFKDANPIDILNEIFATEDRRIVWDHLSRVTSPAMRATGPVRLRFDETNICSIKIPSIGANSDVATEIWAGGNQVEQAPDTCGSKTSDPVDIDTFTLDVAKHAKWQQAATTCTISSTGDPDGPPKTSPELWTRVRTRTTTRCNVVVKEVVETWGYFAPLAARYQTEFADPAALDCLNAKFLDEPTLRGSEDAVAFGQRWTLISRSTTDHFYNAPTWTQGSAIIVGDVATNHFVGDYLGVDPDGKNPRIGYKLGTLTRTETWYAVKHALKVRDSSLPTQPWDEIDYLPNVNVMGSGQGIDDSNFDGAQGFGGYSGQFFRTVGWEVRELRGSADGFLDQDKIIAESFVRRDGSRVLYSDGERNIGGSGKEYREDFGSLSMVQTNYARNKDTNSTTQTEITTDFTRSDSPTQIKPPFSISGGGPVIERLPANAQEELGDLTTDEIATIVPVKRGQNVPMKVHITFPALLISHLEKILGSEQTPISFPYASNPDELRAAAEAVGLDGAALPISFTVPQNFLAFPATLNHLRFRLRAIDHDFTLTDVTHSSADLMAKKYTDLAGLIYPPSA